jgi:hypothetical protein
MSFNETYSKVSIFRGFPQSFQETTGILPSVRPRPLPSIFFPIQWFGRCIFCITDTVVEQATINIRRGIETFSEKLFGNLEQLPRGGLGHFN